MQSAQIDRFFLMLLPVANLNLRGVRVFTVFVPRLVPKGVALLSALFRHAMGMSFVHLRLSLSMLSVARTNAASAILMIFFDGYIYNYLISLR